MGSPLFWLRDDPRLFVAFLIAVVVGIAAVVAVRLVYPNAETAFDIPFSLRLLDILVAVNVILGVFNLLPIPPLDGSSLLALVLPPSRQSIVGFLDQYGIFLLL